MQHVVNAIQTATNTTEATKALGKRGAVFKKIITGFDACTDFRNELLRTCGEALHLLSDKNFGTADCYDYWMLYAVDCEDWYIVYNTQGKNTDNIRLWCANTTRFDEVKHMLLALRSG